MLKNKAIRDTCCIKSGSYSIKDILQQFNGGDSSHLDARYVSMRLENRLNFKSRFKVLTNKLHVVGILVFLSSFSKQNPFIGLYFHLSKFQLQLNYVDNILPMLGFEPCITVVSANRSANCATTTALMLCLISNDSFFLQCFLLLCFLVSKAARSRPLCLGHRQQRLQLNKVSQTMQTFIRSFILDN